MSQNLLLPEPVVQIVTAADLPKLPRPEDVWVLHLLPTPGKIPPAVRVRKLLKWADTLGLRCVRCRDATTEERVEALDWM